MRTEPKMSVNPTKFTKLPIGSALLTETKPKPKISVQNGSEFSARSFLAGLCKRI
ncbi:unnamed protein product [Arabidopsis lyrata]|nr:unnamed protein product [Arabidopsis lyrata]